MSNAIVVLDSLTKVCDTWKEMDAWTFCIPFLQDWNISYLILF